MLDITGRRCVVIGGGPVALRRAEALLEAGGTAVVIAPDIDPGLTDLPLEIINRAYQPGDLTGAWLVVIASDDPQANDQVARDARDSGILVNRADTPQGGDFTVQAAARIGPITLSVDTAGTSATSAAAIRDELADALDPLWPRLIELAGPWRAILQARYPEASKRIPKLKNLCGPRARTILKDQGEAALQAYYDALANNPNAE